MNNQTKGISFCAIATIFIISSLYMVLTCKSCSPIKEYEESLDEQQKKIYNNIVKERMKIYLYGFAFGIIIALGYLYLNNMSFPMANSCIFVSIAFITQHIIYSLYPKSDYMVRHLKSVDQVNKWFDVYRFMIKRFHIGAVIGLIGYFLLSFGLGTLRK